MLELAIIIFTWVVVYIATRDNSQASFKARGEKALKDDMTDIDPVTGDWTSKYDGLRYDKDGGLKYSE